MNAIPENVLVSDEGNSFINKATAIGQRPWKNVNQGFILVLCVKPVIPGAFVAFYEVRKKAVGFKEIFNSLSLSYRSRPNKDTKSVVAPFFDFIHGGQNKILFRLPRGTHNR